MTVLARFLSFAALVCFVATPARAERWIDVEPAAIAYDNLTRAQAPGDRRADQALALDLSGGRAFVLSGTDSVDAALDARIEAYRRYTARARPPMAPARAQATR